MKKISSLSKREFLKVAGMVASGLMLDINPLSKSQVEFPEADRLGRVTEGAIKMRVGPDVNSAEVGTLYQDQVVPWLREVVGSNPYRYNQRWVETPDGYVWCPLLQPVRNFSNSAQTNLPQTSLGEGMWVEVTVPFVNLYLINAEPYAPSVKNAIESGKNYRLYYGQVIWVDSIREDDNGKIWYRLNERYSYGDMFWAAAESFKPLTEDDVAPISPNVEDKRVDVNLTRQTVSCYEGEREVFFTRTSTGQLGGETETPLSDWHRIWRKMVSSHMTGGTTGGGWDLAGIGWTTLFVGTGIAFHSTFWHNNFGERMSRGCVNLSPEDSKYIFRWTDPIVGYDPGDMEVSGNVGTLIRVIED